jgi:hypothetical protein
MHPTLSHCEFMTRQFLLYNSTPQNMNSPRFIFKCYREAVDYNAKILAEAFFPSQISYGSEFRLCNELLPIPNTHPFWPRSKGVTLPLPLSLLMIEITINLTQKLGES